MIPIADNLHAMNPEVARALEILDPAPIRRITARCERAGAARLDLNPGYLSRRNEDRMAFLVETVQEACSLPLMLDGPNPRVLQRGLAACRETPIINALTLEPEKLAGIPPLAAESGADLVLLLMDERSQPPPRMEEKITLALELREHCLSAGLPPEKLIYDPVLPVLSWPDAFSHVREVIRTVRLLSSQTLFPEPARTMAGLSNLRSGLHRVHPPALELACLSMLAGAGLTHALTNVLRPATMTAVDLINRISGTLPG